MCDIYVSYRSNTSHQVFAWWRDSICLQPLPSASPCQFNLLLILDLMGTLAERYVRSLFGTRCCSRDFVEVGFIQTMVKKRRCSRELYDPSSAHSRPIMLFWMPCLAFLGTIMLSRDLHAFYGIVLEAPRTASRCCKRFRIPASQRRTGSPTMTRIRVFSSYTARNSR